MGARDPAEHLARSLKRPPRDGPHIFSSFRQPAFTAICAFPGPCSLPEMPGSKSARRWSINENSKTLLLVKRKTSNTPAHSPQSRISVKVRSGVAVNVNARGVPLSPRGTSGERAGERGSATGESSGNGPESSRPQHRRVASRHSPDTGSARTSIGTTNSSTRQSPHASWSALALGRADRNFGDI